VLDNGGVLGSRAPLRITAATAAIGVALGTGACGGGHPPVLDDPGPPVATAPTDAAGRLAALAATAQDRTYVATYTLTSPGRTRRTVLVVVATDHTWRVDVPGGALSGAADVSVVRTNDGIYQCLLGGPGTTAGRAGAGGGAGGEVIVAPTPSPSRAPSAKPSPSASASPPPPPVPAYTAPACVRIAAADGAVPRRYDPVFEHAFTDWLDVLLDRDAPISIFAASPPAHATGSCFSVEPSSASLVPPIDAGVYCFGADGTMTSAAIAAGTLTYASGTATAPATNTLPAPIVTGPAAPVKAPPVPSASPSATGTTNR
jgi:hypothetical protein